MKNDIHPKIYQDCAVKCACGNSFTTISTVPSINVDICSNCHPFFTGQQRFVDTEGRIEKFNKKAKTMETQKKVVTERKATKSAKAAATAEKPQKQVSLKELLTQVKDEEKSAESAVESPQSEQ